MKWLRIMVCNELVLLLTDRKLSSNDKLSKMLESGVDGAVESESNMENGTKPSSK